jgi:hypothetical protein
MLLMAMISVLGATAWWLDGKAVEHHSWGYKVKAVSRLVLGYDTWCISPFTTKAYVVYLPRL